MTIASIGLRGGMAAATVSALVLLLGISGLATLSEPSRAEHRLAAVKAELDQARRLSSKRNDTGRYPPGMICKDRMTGVAAGRALIDTSAAKASVTLGEDRIFPADANPQAMLATLAVEVAAKGQEGALRAFLRNLVGRDPVILTDSLDLTSDGTVTSLHLKGRIICHDRRLP